VILETLNRQGSVTRSRARECRLGLIEDGQEVSLCDAEGKIEPRIGANTRHSLLSSYSGPVRFDRRQDLIETLVAPRP
jgi:hypothetical protein